MSEYEDLRELDLQTVIEAERAEAKREALDGVERLIRRLRPRLDSAKAHLAAIGMRCCSCGAKALDPKKHDHGCAFRSHGKAMECLADIRALISQEPSA